MTLMPGIPPGSEFRAAVADRGQTCVSAKPRAVARLVIAAALLLQCSGCLVGPDFSSPSAPVADRWLESNDPSVKSALQGSLVSAEHREDWAWWTVFHDPILDRLIRIA